jgi:hypothetical protein
LEAPGFFERFMVIPGWSAVLVAGMLLAWLARYPLLGSLVGHGPNWILSAIGWFEPDMSTSTSP